jgi:hypothetical protein
MRKMTYTSDNYFKFHSNREIELIDTLRQHDFASQQEIWQYLSENKYPKNKVISLKKGDIAGFSSDGNLFNYRNNEFFAIAGDIVDFSNVKDWQKYTPPRLIRVNGVEVPAPLDRLESGKRFWLIDLTEKELAIELSVLDTTNEDRDLWLKRDLCYATKEDAIKRAEAMNLFEVVE